MLKYLFCYFCQNNVIFWHCKYLYNYNNVYISCLCRDFSWSPTDNIIAYWVPEQENVPARVTLMEMPSRKELSAKNLFSVADCKMHWQKNGDYLCVKVDRYSKSRKDTEKDGQVKYSVCILWSCVSYCRRCHLIHLFVQNICLINFNIIYFSWETHV